MTVCVLLRAVVIFGNEKQGLVGNMIKSLSSMLSMDTVHSFGLRVYSFLPRCTNMYPWITHLITDSMSTSASNRLASTHPPGHCVSVHLLHVILLTLNCSMLATFCKASISTFVVYILQAAPEQRRQRVVSLTSYN